MAELVNLVGASDAAGLLIAWVAVGGAFLWLWERYERTRTRVLIERQRRARIKQAAGRNITAS